MSDNPMDVPVDRIAGIEDNLSRLQQNVSKLQQNASRLEQNVNGLHMLVEDVRSDVKLILEHLAPALTRLNDHEVRITALERARPAQP